MSITIQMLKRKDFQSVVKEYQETNPNPSFVATNIAMMLQWYFRSTDELEDLQNQLVEVFPDMARTFVAEKTSPKLVIHNMARWIVCHKGQDLPKACQTISINHHLPS